MQIIDTFQNRLKKAMEIRNIKQVDLVEKTKLDKTLINKYLAGVSNARQRKLTLLADALNVNEIWLMGYDVPMDREVKTDILGNPVVSIPLLGSVKAGYKGDSMAPVFLEEDIVIVKKQNDCENNEFAIVIINGDEGTLKKIKKTDNGIILQPLNPAYGPVMYTKEEMETIPVLIAGIVKQLKREF